MRLPAAMIILSWFRRVTFWQYDEKSAGKNRFRARDGMAALARIPVLPAAKDISSLSAQGGRRLSFDLELRGGRPRQDEKAFHGQTVSGEPRRSVSFARLASRADLKLYFSIEARPAEIAPAGEAAT